MNTVVSIRRPPKAARTQMDTMIINGEIINTWILPPFQRPLRINEKVRMVAAGIKADGGVIPGVLTLGVIERGKKGAGTYLLDGQHRIEAFRIAELPEGIADVRVCHFDHIADMGEAFVELNSSIVSLRPDDVLRGLEGTLEPLQIVRRGCLFVGYDHIRRGPSAPILSMSVVLRCWVGSANETPVFGHGTVQIAKDLSKETAEKLVDFLAVAHEAWGRDPEYARLWAGLNLTVCMWLWRRLVLDKERGVKRYVVLRPDDFKRCLMSLSADSSFLDWLVGRQLSERDRTPCFLRIKGIFAARMLESTGRKALLPQPAWAGTRGYSQ